MLSPGLSELLRGENEGACQMILGDANLTAEAIAQLPVLRAAATQKAGVTGVQEVIGRRFALYPQPDRSDGEWAAWWSDYYDALSDLPWAALEAGMAAYVRDPASEFMPKPGKLRELTMATPTWQARAYNRARYVSQYEPPPARPAWMDEPLEIDPPKVRTVEGATAIKRMAAEAVEALRAKAEQARPIADIPSTAGKPDEGGLTPQMRALMARRAEEGRA